MVNEKDNGNAIRIGPDLLDYLRSKIVEIEKDEDGRPKIENFHGKAGEYKYNSYLINFQDGLKVGIAIVRHKSLRKRIQDEVFYQLTAVGIEDGENYQETIEDLIQTPVQGLNVPELLRNRNILDTGRQTIQSYYSIKNNPPDTTLNLVEMLEHLARPSSRYQAYTPQSLFPDPEMRIRLGR